MMSTPSDPCWRWLFVSRTVVTARDGYLMWWFVWLRTYFDGITADEHGAQLRDRCKQLNGMIEIVVRDQKFQ